jgi:hypothetical protein
MSRSPCTRSGMVTYLASCSPRLVISYWRWKTCSTAEHRSSTPEDKFARTGKGTRAPALSLETGTTHIDRVQVARRSRCARTACRRRVRLHRLHPSRLQAVGVYRSAKLVSHAQRRRSPSPGLLLPTYGGRAELLKLAVPLRPHYGARPRVVGSKTSDYAPTASPGVRAQTLPRRFARARRGLIRVRGERWPVSEFAVRYGVTVAPPRENG